MNDETQSDLICPVCGALRSTYHFVCKACFKRLPQNFRRSFAVLKLQSIWWLREHTTTTNNEEQRPLTFDELR